MTKFKLFSLCFLLMCPFIWAQQDSIALREVTVTDLPLQVFSKTQKVLQLNDSVISHANRSLTSLLQYNTAIYFKENGFGMVSSPSFRGTTAQQTAVVWNGININSQLNGQTDFNTISISNVDQIAVRSGGGSAIYGSSAIGGSIHLNSDLRFGHHFDNEIDLNYGSFETYRAHYKVSAADQNTSVVAGILRTDSQNDYPYLDSKKSQANKNGQFYNTGFDLSAGYKISKIHYLKFYSQLYEGERHFSGTLAAVGKSKYQEVNTRNLLEWKSLYSKATTTLKIAALSEKYKYFDTADEAFFTTGQSQTALARYEVLFPIGGKLLVNSLVEHTQTKGHGSDIDLHERNVSAAALQLHYQLTQKLEFEGSLRKEITNNYDSPLLFSGGLRWNVLHCYTFKLNGSRNFRIPTFNDLYWNGSDNPNLNPESSYQGEIGQEFAFGPIRLSATAYYMDITNMLRWVPGANGIWSPQNVAHVQSYGAESGLDWSKKFGSHQWQLAAQYNYSVSGDKALDNQLTYTPYHKGTASAAYQYKRIGVFYQWLYNGKVYTTTDHAYEIDAYQLSNAGIDVALLKSKKLKLGASVFNIFDQSYQSVASRPMPGTNYTINLNFKF